MIKNLEKTYKVQFTGNFKFGFKKIVSIFDTKEDAIHEAKNSTLFEKAEHCVVYRIDNNDTEKEIKVAVLK